MINILYIHGFGSNADSSTGKDLQKYLGKDFNVVTYSFNNNIEKFSVMKSNIDTAKRIIRDKHIHMIVGSSMGGFIAMNCSGVTKILINPCMLPSEVIRKQLISTITDEELQKYRELEKSIIVDREDRLYTFGLFSTNDELFSYKKLFNKRYDTANNYTIVDKHRISSNNIKNKLVPLINIALYQNKELSQIIDAQEHYSIDESLHDEYLEWQISQINEAFVNALTVSEMNKYSKDVWDILENSYKDIGGTKLIAANVEELITDSDMWKMVKRGGKIVAVQIYTFKRGGRKMVAGGTDGSAEGKAGLYAMMKEDIKLLDRNAWAEVSGAMEYINHVKLGAVPIPSKIAAEILSDKVFIEFDEDGFHYTRMIGNKPIRKLMVGNFKGK